MIVSFVNLKHIVFLLAFCFTFSASAQGFNSSLSLASGYTKNGFAILGTYNHYIKKYNDFVQGSVFAGFIKEKETTNIEIV